MTPARTARSGRPGARAQAARHEPRRVAWTPEAKQISDRTGVTGNRSTSIRPVTSGNWTHRDPIEERGVPCGENRCRATRERTLSLTNLSTKRQRIAKLARTKRGVAFHLRDFLDRRVRDGVSDNIRERSSSMKNRKREICTSGAAAWPIAVRAQQGERVRRIGVLMSGDENDPLPKTQLSAF